MERFQDPTVTVIQQSETLVCGKTVFEYGTPSEPRSKEAYVLIDPVSDNRRFYLSSVIARAAAREIVEHNAKLETLSTNFDGRSQMEMHVFLNKNHVEPK